MAESSELTGIAKSITSIKTSVRETIANLIAEAKDTHIRYREERREERLAQDKRETEARAAQKDKDNKTHMILLALVGAIVGAEVIGTPPIIGASFIAVIMAAVIVTGRIFYVKPRGWLPLLILTGTILFWAGALLMAFATGGGLDSATEILTPTPFIIATSLIWYALVIKKEA